ncbi:MAG: tRNA (guanosine(46)-N7)-methyltransferase TrmB [Phycisphaerae bacterium]|nr:tRNA (guanosine(46)-N7)-methyltransferase TrmB [Phycisphaerae bacterium]
MPDVQQITIDVDSSTGVVAPSAWFGNEHPIELEIGCGKGGFLLRQARAHPERNFVGIEWASKYFRYAADRMCRWGVENVRLVRTDAKHFVMHRLPPACLSALHVYHPDPWPKKRHHKRRLFCAEFVDAAARVLRPGARWAIQTDHAEYFAVIRGLIDGRLDFEPAPFDDPEYGTIDERTETNFEVKYVREGRTIYRLALRRRGST